jgi:hypothetical protein
MRALLLALWLVVVGMGRAHAEVPQAPATGTDLVNKEIPIENKEKEKKEAERTAAEEEAERKRKEKLARVVVLRWNGTETGYDDSTVQRVVRSRVARPDAQFFPEVDLYQEGRKVRDRTVVPAMQPAVVPGQNTVRVMQAVNEVAAVPYNAWPPDAWGLKAQELRELVESIWFVDRVELREPLFLLYAQIGRAAENQNAIAPPFFEQIGPVAVNYYYYLAALMAAQDPGLLNKLTDPDVYGSVQSILGQLQQGVFPGLKVDFEQEGTKFDQEKFGGDYEVYMNGIQTAPDENGQIDVFLGRTDIYLRRTDSGHGLSERLEVTKLEDRRYFVRDVARKKMGLEFIEQLFLHPNECTPALDGDILNYLAIYAKIHEKAEIYVAVPKEGNPNRVWIWRYDRPSANLQLVAGGDTGFPVRFAILLAGGIMYNDATVEYDKSEYQDQLQGAAEDEGDVNATDAATAALDSDLGPSYIPLNIELRGHYNRLMVAFGLEAGFNTGGEDGDKQWIENFYVQGHPEATVIGTGDKDTDDSGSKKDETLFHEVDVNRNVYLGIGVVLGRDAGIGFGPRFATRIGWTNVPYSLQTTGHFGWTLPMPFVKNLGDRVRPLVDVDARLGAVWPFRESLAHTCDNKKRPLDTFTEAGCVDAAPIFGIVAGLGTTF